MRSVVLALALATATACSTTSVNTDYSPTADFKSFRTYTWVTTDPQPGVNPLLFGRIKDTIDREMAAKSYTLSDNPDFAVAITLGARDEIRQDYVAPAYGAYGGFYPGYGLRPYSSAWAYSYSPTQISQVTKGTLAIDVYDAASKEPVWHGTGTKTIDRDNIKQENVDQVIAEVLAKFPPQP
ncbi:MAG: DUF4136 domain-containing protein [Pseudomonadota bacterium]